ncbi:MAG: hypothetical protein FWD60_13390, partial [Candidatus Azobacteroides sp.]|nr:hypothetical protein [Candidatus Azobacteroides sp.]
RVPTDNENDLPYFWDCKMTPLKLPLLCLSIFDGNDSGTIKIYAENYAVKEVKKETKKRVTRYKIITEPKGKSKPNEIALERVERNDNENFEFWNELLMACISGYMFPQNILSGLGKPVDDKEQIEQIQKLFENVWKYSKVMDDEEKLFYLDNIAIAILKGDIVNSDLALSFIKKTHEIAGLNEDERKSVIEDEVFVALLQQKRDDEKDEKIAIEALRQQEREKRKIDWTAVPELLLFIAETVNEYKATSTNSSGESVTGGSANSGGSNCANLQSQYTSLSQKMSSASGTAGYARGQEKVGAISGGQYGDNSASNAAVKSSANQLVRTCQQEMERLQRQAAQCGCPPLR